MIGKILSFATNYRKWLIIGGILIASHGAMYGVGYIQAERAAQVQQVKEAKATTDTTVKAVVIKAAEAQAERIEVKVRDIKRETQLAAQIDTLRSERDALKDALNETPDRDPGVYLRVGDVRMLDRAARGADYGPSEGIPGASSLAAGEEQAASGVSLRQFVSFEADIRFQYRELAARNDALIDWVQKELIDPQIADPISVDRPSNR